MKAVIGAIVACALLAGCNTVAGIGEDITGAATWAQTGIGGSPY